MSKILFIADVHLGAEKRWGVSAERWDQPFREAMNYAADNHVDLVVLAGDTRDKRNPTTEEWKRYYDIIDGYGDWVIEITGNHDIGASADSVSTTDVADLFLPRLITAIRQPSMIELNRESVQVVTLPWPRPVDYGIDASLDLETQIHETRAAVMARLHEICSALDPARPAVLTGHAMVSYGKFRATGVDMTVEPKPGVDLQVIAQTDDMIEFTADPVGPGLLLGKDIVLNFDELCNLPNIKSNVLLGHVHDAAAKGYIGSTQPTDFADTAPKTFTVLEFDEGADDVSKWTAVNYQTSLIVDEATISESDPLIANYPHVDIRRIKVSAEADSTLSEAQLRERFDGMQDRLIVEITRERIERARIETDVPVAQMSASGALATWLTANEIDGEQASRATALFEGLGTSDD